MKKASGEEEAEEEEEVVAARAEACLILALSGAGAVAKAPGVVDASALI